MLAARCGHARIVAMLLERRANIDIADKVSDDVFIFYVVDQAVDEVCRCGELRR